MVIAGALYYYNNERTNTMMQNSRLLTPYSSLFGLVDKIVGRENSDGENFNSEWNAPPEEESLKF